MLFSQYIYFLLGCLAIIAYAKQHFNEPTFSDKENLPHTVEPLRYLFLGPSYKRAQLAYVCVSVFFYLLLVLPGRSLFGAQGLSDMNFPVQAWPLLVALVLVGLIPNSNAKWITAIEMQLRRGVHSFFLVPDGTLRTIGVLEDAAYDPPPYVREAVRNSPKGDLLKNLGRPPGSLDHLWARASMILASLTRLDGAAGPLGGAAFDPFVEDFEDIRQKYRSLEPDVEKLQQERFVLESERERPGADFAKRTHDLADREEELVGAINRLLRRMYAYLSWGIRQRAKTERDVDDILARLGFRIPVIGARRVFDAVVPATLLIFAITFVFWIVHDGVNAILSAASGSNMSNVVNAASGSTMSDVVVGSLYSAISAGAIYGLAISIALKKRSAQIEEKVWTQTSPKCFAPIAIYAGFVSWLVIAATTVVSQPVQAAASLVGVWNALAPSGLALLGPGSAAKPGDLPLWVTLATAFPWVLSGAMASFLLAKLLGGDVRRVNRTDRIRDAVKLGAGLSVAAFFANLLQLSLNDYAQKILTGKPNPDFFGLHNVTASVAVGLAGLCCGLAIGFMAPRAFRCGIANPIHGDMTKQLRALLQRAQTIRSGRNGAEDWAFQPQDELGGISPAEALQYKEQVNRVWALLEDEAPPSRSTSKIVPLGLAS